MDLQILLYFLVALCCVSKANGNFNRSERAAVKSTFYPNRDYSIFSKALKDDTEGVFLNSTPTSFPTALKDVYEHINKNSQWERVKTYVENNLERHLGKNKWNEVKEAIGNKTIDRSSKDKFFRYIIWLYTTKFVYEKLNAMFNNKQYDENLASYGLLLDVLLHHYWDQKTTKLTYRGTTLSDIDVHKYTLGTTFYWLAFVSSTDNETSIFRAKRNVKFTIDNSMQSNWSPNAIKSVAWDPGLDECLYPSGAQFKVIQGPQKAEKQNKWDIHLKLVSTRGSKLLFSTGCTTSYCTLSGEGHILVDTTLLLVLVMISMYVNGMR